MINVCRLCLKVKEEPFNNIIASTLKCSDLTLVDCLYWVFGVEVNVCDPFSKVICLQCIGVVKYVGNFREIFQRNQKILEEKKDSFESYRTNTSLPFNDVDTFFVKNTFSIQNVRESCTSVKKINRNYITKARNQLELSSVPIVILSRLEESNTYKEYKKIHDTLYKKIAIVSKDGGKRAVVKDVDINCEALPVDRFSQLPIINITRFEKSNIYKEYEKIDDVTYKKIANLSRDDTKETKDTCTLTNLNSDEANIEISANPVNNNPVTVPVEIFKNFCFPSLIIPRLENSGILKKYEKVDDTTYKEVSVKSNRSSEQSKFIKYYYSFPTLALRELIKERNEVVSDCNKIIKYPKRKCNKNEPLLNLEDVHHVEVCKYCSKVFKSERMLNFHCKIKHTEFSKHRNNMIKGRKRKKKRAKWGRTKLHATKSFPIKKTKQLTTGPINELKSERSLRNRNIISNNVPSHTVLNGISHKLSKISEFLNTTNQVEHKKFTTNYEHFPNLKYIKDNKGDKLIFRKRKVTRTNQKSEAISGNLNVDIKPTIEIKTVDSGNSEDQNNVKNTAQEEIQLQARDKQQQFKDLHKSDLPEIILNNEEVKEKAINKKIVILGNVNLQNSLSNQSKNSHKNENEKCCETTKLPSNNLYSLNQHSSIKSDNIKNTVNKQSLDNTGENKFSRQINEKFHSVWQLTTDLAYVNNVNVGKDSFTLKRKYQREAEHPKKKKRHRRVATDEGNVNMNITELSGMMSLIEIRDREQTTDSVPVNDTCFIDKNLHATDEQQSHILPVLSSSLEMPSLEPQNGVRPATPEDLTMPLLEKEVVEKTDTIPLQEQMQNSPVVKIIQSIISKSCSPPLDNVSVNFEGREINILNDMPNTLPNENDKQMKAIKAAELSDLCVIDKEISETYNSHCNDIKNDSNSKSDEADCESQKRNLLTFEGREINILNDMPNTLPNENDKQMKAIKAAELSDLCVIDKEISETYNSHCNDIKNDSNSKSDEAVCGSQKPNLLTLIRNRRSYITKRRNELEQCKKDTQDRPPSKSHNVTVKENNPDVMLSNFCGINKEIPESYHIIEHHNQIFVLKSKSDGTDAESQSSNSETLRRNRRSYITKRRSELDQSKKDKQDTPPSENHKVAVKEINPDVLSNFCGIDKEISESCHIIEDHDEIYIPKSKSDGTGGESQSSNSATLRQIGRCYINKKRNKLEQNKKDPQDTLPNKSHNVTVKVNNPEVMLSNFCGIEQNKKDTQDTLPSKSVNVAVKENNPEVMLSNFCGIEQSKKNTQDTLPNKSHNVTVKVNNPGVTLSNFCDIEQNKKDTQDTLPSKGVNVAVEENNPEVMLSNFCGIEQNKKDTQDTLPSKGVNVAVEENNPEVMLSNFCGIEQSKKNTQDTLPNKSRNVTVKVNNPEVMLSNFCGIEQSKKNTQDTLPNKSRNVTVKVNNPEVMLSNFCGIEQNKKDTQDTLPSKGVNVAVKENNPEVMLSNFCGIEQSKKNTQDTLPNKSHNVTVKVNNPGVTLSNFCDIEQNKKDTQDTLPSKGVNVAVKENNPEVMLSNFCGIEQSKKNTQDTLPNKSHNVTVKVNNPGVTLSNFCDIEQNKKDTQDTLPSKSVNVAVKENNPEVMLSNFCGNKKDTQDMLPSKSINVAVEENNPEVMLSNFCGIEQSKQNTQETFPNKSHNVAVKENNPDVTSNFCGIDKKISKSCYINERHNQIYVLKSKSDGTDDESQNASSDTLKQIWRNIRKKKEQIELRKQDPHDTLPSGSRDVAASENNSNVLLSSFYVKNQEILKSDNFNKCYDHVNCDSKSKSNEVSCKNQRPNLETRDNRMPNVGKRKELEKCKRNPPNTPPSGSHDVANENYSNVLLSNFCVIDQELLESDNINKCYDRVDVSKNENDEADGGNQRPNLEIRHNKMSNVKNREELKQCKGDALYTLPSGNLEVAVNENISKKLLTKFRLIDQEILKSNNISKCYDYVKGASKSKSDVANGVNPMSNLETQQNSKSNISKTLKQIEQLKKDGVVLQSEVVKNIIIDHDYVASISLHLE